LPSPSSYPAAVTTLKIWSQNVPATPRRRDRVSMAPTKGSLVKEYLLKQPMDKGAWKQPLVLSTL
jgi:hypothetical protein